MNWLRVVCLVISFLMEEGDRYYGDLDEEPMFGDAYEEEGEIDYDEGVEYDEEDGFGFDYNIEKKHKDVTIGGFTVNQGFNPSANIIRLEYDLSGPLDQGTDEDKRIGHIISAKRITVRFSCWLDPAPGVNYPGGRSCVEYRWFVYVDKVKQVAQRTGNYPTGVSGNNAGTFQAGGFLQYNRMQSFYDRDVIQNFRILHDSGVLVIHARKSKIEYPIAPLGGNVYTNLSDIVQYQVYGQPLS